MMSPFGRSGCLGHRYGSDHFRFAGTLTDSSSSRVSIESGHERSRWIPYLASPLCKHGHGILHT